VKTKTLDLERVKVALGRGKKHKYKNFLQLTTTSFQKQLTAERKAVPTAP
jgi:hypothetical protein